MFETSGTSSGAVLGSVLVSVFVSVTVSEAAALMSGLERLPVTVSGTGDGCCAALSGVVGGDVVCGSAGVFVVAGVCVCVVAGVFVGVFVAGVCVCVVAGVFIAAGVYVGVGVCIGVRVGVCVGARVEDAGVASNLINLASALACTRSKRQPTKVWKRKERSAEKGLQKRNNSRNE